jgi:dTDP-4-dehydrorhamnose reductase
VKVLITGAGGQVGNALARSQPAGIEALFLDRAALDVSDAEGVRTAVLAAQPDVIVNAAAYTAVDRAEGEPQQAQRVNGSAPAHLAMAAEATNARLIHVSTDFVFDGVQSRPYTPDDRPDPLSVYGMTKLEGERAALSSPACQAVLRTSWVYSSGERNFVHTILRLLRERREVSVVDDQFGSPTAASSVARALWQLCEKGEVRGIHHWTDSGVASWYDFAVAVADLGMDFGLLPGGCRVHPIPSSQYPTPARRPRFSVLDKTVTIAALAITPRHWRHALSQVLTEMRDA